MTIYTQVNVGSSDDDGTGDTVRAAFQTVNANLALQDVAITMDESAAQADPGAAKGRLWVRNDAPNVLVFTDDTGAETVLGSGGGGGGTPGGSDTQVQFNTANAFDASAALTWVESGFDQLLTIGDGTQRNPELRINSQNDANGNGKIVFQEAGSGRAQIDFSPVTDTLDVGVIVTGTDTTSILRLLANNQAKQVINREGTTFETAIRFRESSIDPFDDEALFGQLWVRDDAPNVLIFTDDTGGEHDLVAGTNNEKSWNFPNQLDTHTGTARWYPSRDITITRTRANVGIIATNRDILININKNGTPVITGLTIAQAAFLSTEDATVITLLTTDYITVDVTQVGSSAPGEDLVVNFKFN